MLFKTITIPTNKGLGWAIQHVGQVLRLWLLSVEYLPLEDVVLLVDLTRESAVLTLTYELVQARLALSQNKPIAYFAGGKKNGV